MKIYPKDDKRRLYWLVDSYLNNKIDDEMFCNEIYYSYGQEIDKSTLNDTEREAFKYLSDFTNRFSPFESDLKKYPGTYKNKDEARGTTKKSSKSTGKIFLRKRNF
jgi:hypothetical protein